MLGPLEAREVDADKPLKVVEFDEFASLERDDESSALETRQPLSGAQLCKAA